MQIVRRWGKIFKTLGICYGKLGFSGCKPTTYFLWNPSLWWSDKRRSRFN